MPGSGEALMALLLPRLSEVHRSLPTASKTASELVVDNCLGWIQDALPGGSDARDGGGAVSFQRFVFQHVNQKPDGALVLRPSDGGAHAPGQGAACRRAAEDLRDRGAVRLPGHEIFYADVQDAGRVVSGSIISIRRRRRPGTGKRHDVPGEAAAQLPDLIALPLFVLSTLFYRTSLNVVTEQAQKNVYAVVKKNNDVIDTKLGIAEQNSRALFVDKDLFQIFNNLDPSKRRGARGRRPSESPRF